MQIDASELRRHYAQLSDQEFLAIGRADLTGAAQLVYDAELARRNLTLEPVADTPPVFESAPLPEFDTGPDPGWLPEAAIATSFTSSADHDAAAEAREACDALTAAGIPNHLVPSESHEDGQDSVPRQELQIMVPNALALHAGNALDQAIFNPQMETLWRTHMQELSPEAFGGLTEEAICGGYEDLIRRYQRVWRQETARRSAAAHAG